MQSSGLVAGDRCSLFGWPQRCKEG